MAALFRCPKVRSDLSCGYDGIALHDRDGIDLVYLVESFDVVASVIWFVAGAGFLLGLMGHWPVINEKARAAHSEGHSLPFRRAPS